MACQFQLGANNSCHSEPFGFAQDKLREESKRMPELRAKHEILHSGLRPFVQDDKSVMYIMLFVIFRR